MKYVCPVSYVNYFESITRNQSEVMDKAEATEHLIQFILCLSSKIDKPSK